MEFETSFKINKICRICLEENIISSQSIFEQFVYTSDGTSSSHNTAATTTTTTIADIITECTKYPATQNDKLPTQICIKCKEAALTSHLFKRQTEQAYYHLKAIYDKTWSPKQEGKSDDALTTEKYTQTEKLFRNCESCPKQCASKQELKRHRLVAHSNDVKKKCRVCGEGFNHLGQLIVHLSTEHPNEGIHCEFKCHICNREFARKDHMTRHMRKIHKFEFNPPASAKISLEEPEIQFDDPSHAIAQTTSLNNYSSHWPEYKDDDKSYNANYTATNPFDSDNEMEKAAAATTDGHGENMQRQNFIPMNNVDVKQFVGTTVNPEVFIKVEKSDDYHENSIIEKKLKANDLRRPFVQTKAELVEQQQYNNNNGDEYEHQDDDDDDDDNDDDDDYVHDSTIEDNHSDDENSSSGNEDDLDNGNNQPSHQIKIENEQILQQNVKNVTQKFKIEQLDMRELTFTTLANIKTSPPKKRPVSEEENRCKECQRTFTRYNHLLRHMLTHSDVKPHVCNFCGKGFSRSDHLAKHIQSIHCEKTFKCEQCPSAYGRKDHLQRHIATRHNKDQTGPDGVSAAPKRQFDCDQCEKKFTSKNYLAKHRLLHTDRLYACKHCTATFTEKEQMKEHQKDVHTQPRNFLCNICGDSFQRNEYLKIHMRRHTGEKPYKCRFCEKGFPRSTDLKMHERYHIGLKPNLCNLCGKGFHRPYNLTIHMRTHTGEKPYKCNQCPQAFAQSNDLKAHIRRHTGERFRCDLCSAAFLQRYGLNAHLRTVHDIHVTSFTGRLRKTDVPMDGILDAEGLSAAMAAQHQQQQQPQQQQQQHSTAEMSAAAAAVAVAMAAQHQQQHSASEISAAAAVAAAMAAKHHQHQQQQLQQQQQQQHQQHSATEISSAPAAMPAQHQQQHSATQISSSSSSATAGAAITMLASQPTILQPQILHLPSSSLQHQQPHSLQSSHHNDNSSSTPSPLYLGQSNIINPILAAPTIAPVITTAVVSQATAAPSVQSTHM